MFRAASCILLAGLWATTATAAELRIDIHAISPEGVGGRLGTVTVVDTPYGAVFVPVIEGLPPGEHGFHVHAKPDCGPGEKNGRRVAGLAAGGHWDPDQTGRHEGPVGLGHLGDLPRLHVDAEGRARLPVVAPRIRDVTVLRGHALMVHAGGDNYADQPKKLGGGGARIACGVIE